MSHKDAVEQVKTLQKNVPGNLECADCGKLGKHIVKFCSVKLGVFLCNQCYAAHRALGAHITRVKCIGLDSFTSIEVELLTRLGTYRVNACYEANMLSGMKPSPTKCNGCSSRSCQDCTQRLKFIADKYETKLWHSSNPTKVTSTRTIKTGTEPDLFGLFIVPSATPAPLERQPSLPSTRTDDFDPFGIFNEQSTTSTALGKKPPSASIKKNNNDDFFASFGL